MHVRTLAACAGLLLLLTACGSAELEAAAPAATTQPAAPVEAAPEQSADGAVDPAYWSPQRVAALEAAKASFVPPEPPATAAPAPAEPSPAPAPQPAPDPAPKPAPAPKPDAAPKPTAPAPPAPQPAPAPSPSATPDDERAITLPGDDGPVFVVADRNAAVLINGCSVGDEGQRRIAYDVILRDGEGLRVLADRASAEHGETSRTELVAETEASAPISFVLIEDDPQRAEDFSVPAVQELHLGTAEAGKTVVVPAAIVPVALCE